MRWRLLLEEFGPKIVYIKGPKNVVADALSRLPKKGDIVDDVEAILPFASKDEATLYWDNMETDVSKFTKTCPTCQRFKKSKKKNGKLPPKEVTMIPWETICIDLIGPYTVTG